MINETWNETNASLRIHWTIARTKGLLIEATWDILYSRFWFIHPVPANQVSHIKRVGGRVTIGSGAITHMQVVVNCETLQIVCQFCGGAALLDAGDVVAAVSEHIVASDCVRRSVYQLSATVVFVAVCMNVVKSVKYVR